MVTIKRVVALLVLILSGSSFLTGCDPVLPSENIQAVYSPQPINLGGTAIVEIVYPETDGTAVVEWTDARIEILQGDDILEVSGLTLKGLKAGQAVLKVEATANCAFLGVIIDNAVLTTELEVVVA